jgi:hypothetical protein
VSDDDESTKMLPYRIAGTMRCPRVIMLQSQTEDEFVSRRNHEFLTGFLADDRYANYT